MNMLVWMGVLVDVGRPLNPAIDIGQVQTLGGSKAP